MEICTASKSVVPFIKIKALFYHAFPLWKYSPKEFHSTIFQVYQSEQTIYITNRYKNSFPGKIASIEIHWNVVTDLETLLSKRVNGIKIIHSWHEQIKSRVIIYHIFFNRIFCLFTNILRTKHKWKFKLDKYQLAINI